MTLLNIPSKVEHDSFEHIFRSLIPGLPDAPLSSLEQIHELRRFESGEVILREGTASQGVIVVCSGVVSVSIQSPAGPAVKLREIAAPAILGLSETMLGQTFKTTVTCELPVQAVLLPTRQFIDVIRQFPAASIQFSGFVSDELNATYACLAELRRPLPGSSR